MISDTACVHWCSKLESNSLVAITAMGISMIIMHDEMHTDKQRVRLYQHVIDTAYIAGQVLCINNYL